MKPRSYNLATNRPLRAKQITEERVYVRLWRRRNRRVPWLNGGYTLLEHILTEKFVSAYEHLPPGHPDLVRPKITPRDAKVATSVIQWLGTKEGKIFIEDAEREIKRCHDRDMRLYDRRSNGKHPRNRKPSNVPPTLPPPRKSPKRKITLFP